STQHGVARMDHKSPGNVYTRIVKPTYDVPEPRVADRDDCDGALLLACGKPAITSSFQATAVASHNIVSTAHPPRVLRHPFAHTLPRQGIEVRFAPHDDIAAMEALIDENTKAVFCESIGNPAGNIIDLKALADAAHRHGVPLIVDNTVATPVLCRPFEHGAD